MSNKSLAGISDIDMALCIHRANGLFTASSRRLPLQLRTTFRRNSQLSNGRPYSRKTSHCIAYPAPFSRIKSEVYLSRCTRQFSSAQSASDAFDNHNKTVKEISATIRGFYARKEKFRIFHGSTNSTRQSILKRNLVDTSSLSHVLKVDLERKTCLVEPNVSMDRLVEATLKYGLVPPVVMEFPGITVGGGYSGTSGESSSFKHGFFDRTINNVEMVLADGQVVNISPAEKGDLFQGAAGAVGRYAIFSFTKF